MTSTYLPFFRPFTVLPFRAWGAPSRSSIELAWLRAVPGRDGGPEPGIPVETDLGIRCGLAENGTFSEPEGGVGGKGEPEIFGTGGPPDRPGEGTGIDADAGGPTDPDPAEDGGPLPLAVLLGGAGPLGGGGVACAAELEPSGSFLLTHLCKSSSK